MPTGSSEAAGEAAVVFRYVISSTEMRHIERAERFVYLRLGEDGRLRLTGEIPGCGAACHADLATLLLEYALSCEGEDDPRFWLSASHAFADSVGAGIAAALAERDPGAVDEARGRRALDVVVVSLGAFDLALLPAGRSGVPPRECPLCAAAASGGTLRVATMAHQVFEDVCRAAVETAAPGWTVAFEEDYRQEGHSLRPSLRVQGPP